MSDEKFSIGTAIRVYSCSFPVYLAAQTGAAIITDMVGWSAMMVTNSIPDSSR
jgi:hypothetical protein